MKKCFVIPFFLWVCLLSYLSEAAQAVNVKVRKALDGTADITKEYIGTAEAIQSVTVKPELSAKISRVYISIKAHS